MSACRHDLGWVYTLNYSRGYEMRCATCGIPKPEGMRPVRQPTYPPHMLIGAAIVLAVAVFLVGLVFWQKWLS